MESITISSIPHPILSQILTSQLKSPYKNICSIVCKNWNQIISSSNPIVQTKKLDHLMDMFARDLHLLLWTIQSYNVKPTLTTSEHAAHGGHLEILQWLKDRGIEFKASTCSSAAAGGHLDI